MKRRTFIQQTAMASAAMVSLPACARANKPATSNEPLGVALVGLGSYSTGQLAPALQLTQHCQLLGIVTGSPEKIPVWQRRHDIPDRNVYNYDNLHRIADNDDIDVIYIVVPTGLHAKYAIQAAEAGKHVWCEKPMAMTVEECQRIIDACEANKVRLSIGYRMQHEPNTQTVIQYADTKPYGAIRELRAEAGYAGGGGTGWRFERKMGGGALYDMGVYTINGLRYASGLEPSRVIAAKMTTDRPKIFTEVDETTEYQLEFPSGIIGHGRTSVGQSMNVLRVSADRGWYELRPMQTYSGVRGETSDGKLLDQEVNDQQARQMDNDALAIKTQQPVRVPGIEGLRDIAIVQAIREAAETGKSIELG